MPWRFLRTARTWRQGDSTARSDSIARRTADWKRASFRYRSTEVHREVAGVALDRGGADGVGLESLGPAGDHRRAAARSTAGEAIHADAHRQEPRRRREDSVDAASDVHAVDSRSPGADT